MQQQNIEKRGAFHPHKGNALLFTLLSAAPNVVGFLEKPTKLAHFGITHYHYYFLSKINYKLETVSCKQSSQYMLIILSLGGREGLLTLNKNFILKQIIICMLETCINSLIFR